MTYKLRVGVVAMILVMAAVADAGEWALKKKRDHVEVTLAGELFTRFIFHDEEARFPYLHPLLAVDGGAVTRRFPMEEGVDGEESDHPHHRSLWVAHGNVDDADFWHGRNTRIVPESIKVSGDTLNVRLRWEHEGEVLLGEERSMRFHSGGNGERCIDLSVRLRAVGGERRIGDTKEGTFAMRLAPGLVVDGSGGRVRMENADELKNEDVWGKASRWVVVHGHTENDTPVAVVMMSHPDNPGGITTWHARTYGLLAANPFGQNEFGHEASGRQRLAEGSDLLYRLRIIIAEDGSAERIESLWDDFVGE